MSTERPSFGLNSILPSSYRSKAEAFAKCLQDKLRSLGGADDSGDTEKGQTQTEIPNNNLSKYSEEEIADNVFLQGPLSYKRRSIPEHSAKPYTNGRSGKYMGSVVDKRGFSSDSEDSDGETPKIEASVHPRVAQLQAKDELNTTRRNTSLNNNDAQHQAKEDTNGVRRLTSVNSNDSTSSFCSCDDGGDADDDEEIIDTFASQIKGSPTIHNPRMKNYKRKSREERLSKEERVPLAPLPVENDLFFDFDVECFSPVNLEEDADEVDGFQSTRLQLLPQEDIWAENETEDTGQKPEETLAAIQGIITPPPSPVKELEAVKVEGVIQEENTRPCDEINDLNGRTVDSLSPNESDSVSTEQEIDLETSPATQETKKETSHEIKSQQPGDADVTECDLTGGSHGNDKIETEYEINAVTTDTIEKFEIEDVEKIEKEEANVSIAAALSNDEDVYDNQNNVNIESDVSESRIIDKEEDEKIKETVELKLESTYSESSSTINVESTKLEESRCDVQINQSSPEDTTLEDVSSHVQIEETKPDASHEPISNIYADESKLEDTPLHELSVIVQAEEPLTESNSGSEAVAITVTKCEEDIDIDPDYLPSPRMKLRRCSSLKTWKTPPGTPGRKKIVRFADALGLDLADVRTFLDEIPKIPNSAYDDLHYMLPVAQPPAAPTERTFIPMFQQPGMQSDFLQRVRQNHVCLESAVLSDVSLLAISGMIRVRNVSFHKTVHVRYSKDNWTTFSDLQATYIPNSSDGFCDIFSFTLYGHTLSIGERLEFAIRYDSETGQFWDSNGGANYVFQCLPRSPIPVFPPLGSSPVDTWAKFY